MKNHRSCSMMSYPWGSASDNFHLATIHKDTSLFSPGESWLLINLLYHVLGANNHFHLSIKINLLQQKNTHISDILCFACAFLGDSPTCWCHSLILSYVSKNSHLFELLHLLYFLPITVSFLTYLVIFTPDKTLLIFRLSLTDLFHVYNQS